MGILPRCDRDARDAVAALMDADAGWVTFGTFERDSARDAGDVTEDFFDAEAPEGVSVRAEGVLDDDAVDASADSRAETEVREFERTRARLAEAEANALRATSALDAERAARERERIRYEELLRAKGDDASEGSEVGGRAGWGTRVVVALARAEPTPRREALERFVRRARAGEGAREDGALRMTLVDAEALVDELKTQDAVLSAAREEAALREALLAKFQAEAESSALRLRDHDEAHALLTAEIGDLRDALAKSTAECNALAEETTALNEALTNAKAEALEWKNAADVLKRMQGVKLDANAKSGDKMLILELECALEALTTTRAELEEANSRLAETTRRAERAEKREAVAAAALEASESRAKHSVMRDTGVNGVSRDLKERLDRAEVRVAQLQRRLDLTDGEHAEELLRLQREHERLSLNLKMTHLTQNDATELMRLEIADVKREAAERAGQERDEFWRRVLEEEREAHANQMDALKRNIEKELFAKSSKLQRFRQDLVQMLRGVQ